MRNGFSQFKRDITYYGLHVQTSHAAWNEKRKWSTTRKRFSVSRGGSRFAKCVWINSNFYIYAPARQGLLVFSSRESSSYNNALRVWIQNESSPRYQTNHRVLKLVFWNSSLVLNEIRCFYHPWDSRGLNNFLFICIIRRLAGKKKRRRKRCR